MPRKQIIIGTSKQRSKLTHLVIASHHQTLYTILVLHLIAIFISKTCRSYFFHIRDLRRIRRYISFSVTKTIATTPTNSRLDYCYSLLYNIAYKAILKLQRVQNCLGRVVRRSPRFSHCPTSEISSLVPFSISQKFQTLHYCPSNSFFWRTFISIFRAFLAPKLRELRSSDFHLLSVPRIKFIQGLVLFQLLSLLFVIHSLNVLNDQIV